MIYLANFFQTIAAFILLLFTAQAAWSIPGGDDWSAWGGPNHNFTVTPGVIKTEQPIELKIAWKKELGSGYSAISMKDGMAVTMFSDSTSDFVIALNVEDGGELWRFKIESTFHGRYGSADGPVSTPLLSENKVVGLSATGRLFVLDRKNGELIWDSNLVTAHHAEMPFYGFGTSPILLNNILVVETGGSSENAISAFDLNNGQVLWTASSDTVKYQTPHLLQNSSGSQFVGITNRALYGLQPETGNILWRFEHEGTNRTMGAPSANLVPVGGNQFFLKNTSKSGMLLKIENNNEMYQVHEVWQTKAIKGTYVVPVYHNGHLFGYNSRIFACVNAETGERTWRSRAPGDGFPIVVDGHLVVITKNGRLSVAPASSEGYNEIAGLDLFDNLVWAPASIANNRLLLRSMTEIAAVDIVPTRSMVQAAATTDGIVPDSKFAQFVEKAEQSEDKSALVSEFMAAQKEFPVIEGDDIVHFIYQGEANDMGLMGDLVGWRFDRPMHRIAGTDLFYYSSRLESDTGLIYKFLKDFQTPLVDSLNTRTMPTMFYGPASWFNMPKWEKPDFLEATASQTGRIDSLQFKNTLTDSSRVFEVYLPANYDESSEAYPVAYMHSARGARGLGNITNALDNLIGSRIRPVIVVFMPTFYDGDYNEYMGDSRDGYLQIFIDEIIPLVEKTYRVLPGAKNRATIGHLMNAGMAFYSTFKHRQIFGKLGIQSMWWDGKEAAKYSQLLAPVEQDKLQIYYDWGKYDFRSPQESMNLIEASPNVARLLKTRGFNFVGGEVNAGTGWSSWKNRLDRLFIALFPLSD